MWHTVTDLSVILVSTGAHDISEGKGWPEAVFLNEK